MDLLYYSGDLREVVASCRHLVALTAIISLRSEVWGWVFKWHVLWTNGTDTKLSGAIVGYSEMPWRSDRWGERIFVQRSLEWPDISLTGRGAVIPSKLEMQEAQWTLYVFAVIGGASPYHFVHLCSLFVISWRWHLTCVMSFDLQRGKGAGLVPLQNMFAKSPMDCLTNRRFFDLFVICRTSGSQAFGSSRTKLCRAIEAHWMQISHVICCQGPTPSRCPSFQSLPASRRNRGLNLSESSCKVWRRIKDKGLKRYQFRTKTSILVQGG